MNKAKKLKLMKRIQELSDNEPELFEMLQIYYSDRLIEDMHTQLVNRVQKFLTHGKTSFKNEHELTGFYSSICGSLPVIDFFERSYVLTTGIHFKEKTFTSEEVMKKIMKDTNYFIETAEYLIKKQTELTKKSEFY
jgi:hypothetical protein